MRFLPSDVRRPISLAYLLARTSDTIADTNWIPAESRLASLHQFAERMAGETEAPLNFHRFAGPQTDQAEAVLLRGVNEAVESLDRLEPADRSQVQWVLSIIISGQELDLQRFASASKSNVVALTTASKLDDYTYRVAGCVGEFWTRVCLNHLSVEPALTVQEMIELSTRYGQGLQLVNILRDLPRDLQQGRCYLPLDQLDASGLVPADLLNRENEARVRPLFNRLLDQTNANLQAGWHYTNAYPRSAARIRIACALPVLIGWRTLALLRQSPILDPQVRVKVSRSETRRLTANTILRHAVPFLWRGLAKPHLHHALE
jgi:farnesyl-diphosphate farnesyltransferase